MCDVLPTPVNLHRFGLAEAAEQSVPFLKAEAPSAISCSLVGKFSGTYRWKHDQVFSDIADTLSRATEKDGSGTSGAQTHYLCVGWINDSSRAQREDNAQVVS